MLRLVFIAEEQEPSHKFFTVSISFHVTLMPLYKTYASRVIAFMFKHAITLLELSKQFLPQKRVQVCCIRWSLWNTHIMFSHHVKTHIFNIWIDWSGTAKCAFSFQCTYFILWYQVQIISCAIQTWNIIHNVWTTTWCMSLLCTSNIVLIPHCGGFIHLILK